MPFALRAAAFALAALASGCGTLDRVLIGGSSAPLGFQAAAPQPPQSRPPQESGLAKIDDPRVFLRSAAQISQDARAYQAAAAHWAGAYAANPKDREAALNLSRNLRYIGRLEDAERILRQGLRDHPQDSALREEHGKLLIASGRLAKGAAELETLAATPELEPRRAASLLAAAGVAFDRSEDHASARARYERALQLDPLNTKALNNLGLSFALSGDLERAETTLREALVSPNASLQVRQNLAMVLALKGDSETAERLAQQDMPRSAAEEAVAFYRALGRKEGAFTDAGAPADPASRAAPDAQTGPIPQ